MWCAALLSAWMVLGAALGPADRASVGTMMTALARDPFAEEPLKILQRIYERGPGVAALVAEYSKRDAFTDLVVRGRIELQRGRRPEAVRAFEQALKQVHDPATLRRLARQLDDAGGRDSAIAAYRGGLAELPANERRNLLFRIGVLAYGTGKEKDALAAWAEARQLAPQDQALRRQIAETMATHNRWKDALTELSAIEPMLSKDPAAMVVLLRREAELARRDGARARSSELLVRAYLLAAQGAAVPASTRSDVFQELVRLYKAGKDATKSARKQGLDELLAVVKHAEEGAPAAGGLVGEVLAEKAEAPAAIAAFERSLRGRPDDTYLLRRLVSLRRDDSRVRDLERLFDLERGDASVGVELIEARLTAGQKAEALRATATMKTRFFDNPTVLAELGQLLGKRGEHATALALRERVTRLDRGPDAIVAYADELLAASRQPEAIAAYRRLVATDASPTSYRHLIQILTERKLTDEVKRVYLEALKRTPDDQLLRRDFARWLDGAGSVDEAIGEWKKIQNGSTDAFLREYATRELKRLESKKLMNR